MAEISGIGEKGKDILAALERLAIELPIARILIVFLLFCDSFMFVATGQSFLTLGWAPRKEIPFGGVFLCVAAFSFARTVVAPLCLMGLLWFWFNVGTEIVDKIREFRPRSSEERRPDVETYPASPWALPPSPLEQQLQRGQVSTPQLYKHALRQQSPFVLNVVEKRENEDQSEYTEFSRAAYWSLMTFLLTLLDLSLGWRGKGSALWIVTGKLGKYPAALWMLGGCLFLFHHSATFWIHQISRPVLREGK